MPLDPVYSSLVTGTTAVLSGLIGYGAARGQRLLELRKLESEDSAARRKATADAKRERRDLYLAYLAEVDALRPMLLTREPTREELNEWWEAFLDAGRKLELSAVDRVCKATGPLYDLLNKATEWIEPDAVARIKARLDDGVEPLNKARGDVLDEMRADVGPKEQPTTGVSRSSLSRP
jgi:hypothetical protein